MNLACLTVNSNATVPTVADGETIVKESNSNGTVRFIPTLCRSDQMQMLAFWERVVCTRSAATLDPVLQVTRRVLAQNTRTTATGRSAACQLPLTMPITRLSTLPCSRRLSPSSVIPVTAWTARLTGNRSFSSRLGCHRDLASLECASAPRMEFPPASRCEYLFSPSVKRFNSSSSSSCSQFPAACEKNSSLIGNCHHRVEVLDATSYNSFPFR